MSDDRRRALRTLGLGYAAALALTLAAFASTVWPWGTPRAVLGGVLALALVQALVHFRVFLHVRLDPGSRRTLWLLLFAALVIALMAAGTIVMLANLHGRMM